MQLGTVKFYNSQKGFGLIDPDDGGSDVFVHATALERAGIQDLTEGKKSPLTLRQIAARASWLLVQSPKPSPSWFVN